MADDPKNEIEQQERRRDDALRRALSMPPKKHKPSEGLEQSKGKPTKKRGAGA